MDYEDQPYDLRPNDLLSEETSLSFLGSGYHVKDYHVYLWALLEQIDVQIASCGPNSIEESETHNSFQVYPNPNEGHFTLVPGDGITPGEVLLVHDAMGRLVLELVVSDVTQIQLREKGMYFLNYRNRTVKAVVN